MKSGDRSLDRIRIRLTIWYATTFLAILLSLGVGLIMVVRQQLSRQLDDTLASATSGLAQLVAIESKETGATGSPYVAAVSELRIPGVTLHLLTIDGMPLAPNSAAKWIRRSAVAAAQAGTHRAELEAPGERILRLHARRFTGPGEYHLVAVAIADEVELENRYAELIGAFASAAALALIMVGVGGWILVRKSIAPVEAAMDNMRRFMADAAHELKTPVAVLRANAEVALLKERDNAGYRVVLRTVEAEAVRLGSIVDGLLLLARADAGERKVERHRFFLDDITLAAVAGAHAMAEQRDVRLDVNGFEEAAIVGDSTLIREMILVLLDNALKFTPAGGRVEVSVLGGDRPELIVEDSGIGIAPEHLPHVFERFYRADSSRDRSGGAGLGLSIAKWIAEDHNAVLSLRSNPQEGTRVTVRFPPPGPRREAAKHGGPDI